MVFFPFPCELCSLPISALELDIYPNYLLLCGCEVYKQADSVCEAMMILRIDELSSSLLQGLGFGSILCTMVGF